MHILLTIKNIFVILCINLYYVLHSMEGGAVDTQIKKGLLDICVLAVLRDSPSYGYKVITNVSKYIETSESTLYPILKRLENNNFVSTYSEEHNGRLRKYYKIEDMGIMKLELFIKEWPDIENIYKLVKEGNND